MTQQDDNQGSSYLQQDDRFADFQAPCTTDGGYRGQMKHKQATEAHLQRKFEERLEEVKGRLKAGKVRVGLKVTSGSIQLQATLPPKLDSNKTGPYQQLISLNIPANLDGLITAEEEAHELGKLIARKTFEWNDKYLNKSKSENEEIKIPTIGELYENFEEMYFKKKPKKLSSEGTIREYKDLVRRYFPFNDLITKENVVKALDAISSQSLKFQSYKAIRALITAFDLKIELDFSKYKQPKPLARTIPTDKEIEKSFLQFQHYLDNWDASKGGNPPNLEIWRWFYGMNAVFGLRPREMFVKPDFDWWLSNQNTDLTWKVHEDCKTGERQALPLHKQWIETFDLRNIDVTNQVRDFLINKQNSNQLSALREKHAYWFRTIGLGFKPYDLRHAWAIRAHILGIPIKAAADNLGHSVDIHTKTYQRWFGLENRKLVMNYAVTKKSEVDLLKEENEKLKREIDALKLQNQRLELELQYRNP